MATSLIKKENIIVYKNLEVSGTYAAGTIGTRGAQFSKPISEILDDTQNYYLMGAFVAYVSDSSKFFPVVFYASNTVYCNFYRASESALTNGTVTIRLMFVHKDYLHII